MDESIVGSLRRDRHRSEDAIERCDDELRLLELEDTTLPGMSDFIHRRTIELNERKSKAVTRSIALQMQLLDAGVEV